MKIEVFDLVTKKPVEIEWIDRGNTMPGFDKRSFMRIIVLTDEFRVDGQCEFLQMPKNIKNKRNAERIVFLRCLGFDASGVHWS